MDDPLFSPWTSDAEECEKPQAARGSRWRGGLPKRNLPVERPPMRMRATSLGDAVESVGGASARAGDSPRGESRAEALDPAEASPFLEIPSSVEASIPDVESVSDVQSVSDIQSASDVEAASDVGPAAEVGSPHLADEGARRLHSVALPYLEGVAFRLGIARHHTLVDDRLDATPPTLRFRLVPRRAPFDEPEAVPGAVLELVTEGTAVVARVWLDLVAEEPTEELRCQLRRLDAAWLEDIVMGFVARTLTRG